MKRLKNIGKDYWEDNFGGIYYPEQMDDDYLKNIINFLEKSVGKIRAGEYYHILHNEPIPRHIKANILIEMSELSDTNFLLKHVEIYPLLLNEKRKREKRRKPAPKYTHYVKYVENNKLLEEVMSDKKFKELFNKGLVIEFKLI